MPVNREPIPYGTDFNSVDELLIEVEQRRKEGISLFGHAVIWLQIKDSDLSDRIGATVLDNGDIMLGAHGEYC